MMCNTINHSAAAFRLTEKSTEYQKDTKSKLPMKNSAAASTPRLNLSYAPLVGWNALTIGTASVSVATTSRAVLKTRFRAAYSSRLRSRSHHRLSPSSSALSSKTPEVAVQKRLSSMVMKNDISGKMPRQFD